MWPAPIITTLTTIIRHIITNSYKNHVCNLGSCLTMESNHSIFKTTHYFRFLTEYLQKFVIVGEIVSINNMLKKTSM
jgi:hypothetical protein